MHTAGFCIKKRITVLQHKKGVVFLKAAKIETGKLEKRNYKWIYLFLLPSVLVFLMFYLQPILTVFYTSFTKWDGFNASSFIG